MAILYIRGPSPIWFFSDHTGQPLDDTYWAFFKANTLPYAPQDVFQTPNGTPWPYPMEFQPSAGLPNNLYFSPELVYRIEIRQGDHDSDPLIWLIENYIPGDTQGGSTDTDSLLTAENLLTNPQFADIYFSSPLTISTAGTYDIAPGWQLELVGTGTVSTTITQGTTAGTDEDIGNPAYYLRFQNSGWTSATLFQRLDNNGSLFAQGAVGIAFSAFATSNEEQLPVYYTPSDAGTAKLFLTADVQTGGFQQFGNAIELPVSTNTTTGTAGYVDIRFALPGESDISISNVQFTGQNNSLVHSPLTPVYQEISYARMVDHEFNVYKDPLKYKPIPSFLVGWDFSLNPAQLYGPTITSSSLGGANLSRYVWDQTIAFIAVDSTLSFARDAFTGGLQVINLGANTRFALIQYLTPHTLQDILIQPNAVQLSASLSSASTSINGTVTLYWTTDGSLPVITPTTYLSLVSAIAADGVPTAGHGTWTAVARGAQSVNAPFTITNSGINIIDLTGFDASATSAAEDATYFAIVVAFDTLTQNSILTMNYCSLVGGSIPTRPAPQTPDEVLRECQYYYEHSYGPDLAAGAVTFANIRSVPGNIFNDTGPNEEVALAQSFYQPWRSRHITPPVYILYAADGSGNAVLVGINRNGTYPSATPSGTNPRNVTTTGSPNLWDVTASISVDGAVAICQKTSTELLRVATVTEGDECIIQYHYTADSLLGGNIR